MIVFQVDVDLNEMTLVDVLTSVAYKVRFQYTLSDAEPAKVISPTSGAAKVISAQKDSLSTVIV